MDGRVCVCVCIDIYVYDAKSKMKNRSWNDSVIKARLYLDLVLDFNSDQELGLWC